MQQNITCRNYTGQDGKPAGGFVDGVGLAIRWQSGPLGRGDSRKVPNGAFIETVLSAIRNRIEYYQAGEFACQENADALVSIRKALYALETRTADREARNVEGTHAL